MKNTLLLFFTILIIASCDNQAKWHEIKSDDLGLSIDFPAKPKLVNRETETEFGIVNLQMYVLDAQKMKDDNYLYMAGHSVYPDSIVRRYSTDDFLNSIIDNIVLNYQGKVLSVKNIVYKGLVAREVKLDYKNGDSIMIFRVYLINNEQYMIGTMTNPAKDNNESQKRFFNSFEIIRAS